MDRTDHGATARTGDRRGVDVEGRWQAAQSRFLEAPREAVTEADQLVQDVVEDIRRRLDDERHQVGAVWQRDEADTEDLRDAMLRYRELLDRLASR